MDNKLEKLPPKWNDGLVNIETVEIMREVAKANRRIAELKGYSEIVPNKNILINAIAINEAKESSEIENIITTHDELFQSLANRNYSSGSAKEVLNCKDALWRGISLIRENGILTTNMIVEIQSIIEENNAGIRTQAGTVLMNDKTGEIVYRPPGTEKELSNLLWNLEQFINIDDDIDPLIKLAIIHYQFESIHPFYDGNGRTGRIINELYLVMKDLLDSPILYLSKYVLETKSTYYMLLNEVHTHGNWEAWIIYILKGIQDTSERSLQILKELNQLIEKTSIEIKDKCPKIHSKELVDLIFTEFYTRISSAEKELNVTRKTASNYLSELVDAGILEVEVKGKDKIFMNTTLINLMKRL